MRNYKFASNWFQATSHGVVPQSAVNALLLWVLTTNNFAMNNNNNNNNKDNAIKFNKTQNQSPIGNGNGHFDENGKSSLPMGPPMLPPVVNFPMMLQNVFPGLGSKLPLPVGKLFPPSLSVSSSVPMPALPIVSTPGSLPSPVQGSPGPIPSFLQALLNGEAPSNEERRNFVAPPTPMPSKLAVEGVVNKLTRRHVGPNDKVTMDF